MEEITEQEQKDIQFIDQVIDKKFSELPLAIRSDFKAFSFSVYRQGQKLGYSNVLLELSLKQIKKKVNKSVKEKFGTSNFETKDETI